MDFEITSGGASAVGELKTLWLQMLSHHRDLVGDEIPVHADERSWTRTRRAYSDWLKNNPAMLVIARDPSSTDPLGYAVCRLVSGDGMTFDLGTVRGDVDSLVVHDEARGRGIGTALLDAVRRRLADRGIQFWSIGVLARNDDAVRLYERVGFRPWTQELITGTGAHRAGRQPSPTTEET